jgi:hypothetical protein
MKLGFRSFIILFFIIVNIIAVKAQVENVPVSHPIYSFLKRMQVKGCISDVSFFQIPFSRNYIIELLKIVRSKDSLIASSDKELLRHYENEFGINDYPKAVLIRSRTDSTMLLFKRLFSSDEKYIYHFYDSLNSVSVRPLGSFNLLRRVAKDSDNKAAYANLGFRVYGTISNLVGYYLQLTNGKFLVGERDFAISEDKALAHSVKFTLLNSDFDLTESHIRLEKDWFYCGIARETRFLGSGISQNIVVSDNAPPMDEFYTGVKFKNFRYNFSNFSLIAKSKNNFQTSVNADIPPKYFVIHTASFIFQRWNLTYFQSVMYSGRSIELAYINPLTFIKSVEHSLHDRDKVSMGLSLEVVPLRNLQILGTWMMEDMVFSEIGKGFWGNKTAWNVACLYAFDFPVDIGIEYTRVEPYMFTHFNNVNNRTNDGRLIGTYLKPNSDELAVLLRSFWLGRYPLSLRISYQRHGDNVVDDSGKVVRNVGGDFNTNYTNTSSYRVTFLDGIRNDLFRIDLGFGFEIVKNLNFQGYYSLRKYRDNPIEHFFKVVLRLYEF